MKENAHTAASTDIDCEIAGRKTKRWKNTVQERVERKDQVTGAGREKDQPEKAMHGAERTDGRRKEVGVSGNRKGTGKRKEKEKEKERMPWIGTRAMEDTQIRAGHSTVWKN